MFRRATMFRTLRVFTASCPVRFQVVIHDEVAQMNVRPMARHGRDGRGATFRQRSGIVPHATTTDAQAADAASRSHPFLRARHQSVANCGCQPARVRIRSSSLCTAAVGRTCSCSHSSGEQCRSPGSSLQRGSNMRQLRWFRRRVWRIESDT